MGLVLSICKRKRRIYHDPIVHNNFTQTTLSSVNNSPSISSEKTQCSAISRQPTKNILFQDPYYFSPSPSSSTYSKPIRGYPDFPIFSSPFYLPSNNKNQFIYHSSSPYLSQTNNHKNDLTRITKVTTIDHHDSPIKSNLDDGGRLIKRSTSAPIDMFLIDISNEQVLLGQPVSMNIRHLLLDTLENQPTNSSTPICIEPSTVTTYAHENLLNYIPHICERYQNVTVDAEQVTRNTLHVRMPT